MNRVLEGRASARPFDRPTRLRQSVALQRACLGQRWWVCRWDSAQIETLLIPAGYPKGTVEVRMTPCTGRIEIL